MDIDRLEEQLGSFDACERRAALCELVQAVENGLVEMPQSGSDVNVHCHTFFSYNCYGYSPSRFAWLARRAGLEVAGTVDFDVLDSLDEFYEASAMLGLKGCVGIETRVFVPEFSDREINSPGEPGISYYMGVGFPSAGLTGKAGEFLAGLKQMAGERNVSLLERVNDYLKEIELDYERDVLPLTPAGNATERHICAAYVSKAREVFGSHKKLAAYWSDKLEADAASLSLPDGVALTNALRGRTMKRCGVGYVQPSEGSFPTMVEMNQFVLDAGAIPTHTWLNGMSDGEKAIEELLEVAMSTGAAAINIVPDRNFTAGVKDEKLDNLYHVVEVAEKLDLPVVVGTEMNSPGQKFVDSFDSEELKPLTGVFLKGAHIVYAHSVLQRMCGLGYVSDWAGRWFADRAVRNEFFEGVGAALDPSCQDCLADCDENSSPEQVLTKV